MGKNTEEEKDWRRHARTALDKKARRRQMRKAETATIRHAHKFVTKRFHNVVEVRQRVFIWLTGVIILIAAVGVQQLWFQKSYKQAAFTTGGTYAEAELGPLSTLNPLFAKSPAEIAVSRLVFASLYSYDKAGAINRSMADELSISKDGRTYTIQLKDGVFWHDGQKLTAKDVAFTTELIKDSAVRSPLRGQWQDVGVKVKDEKTIIFTLPAPYAPFLHALSIPILPEHVLRDIPPSQLRENSFGLHPIGSGPFAVNLLQNAGGDTSIANLVAFEDYFGGKPKLARFEIHAYRTRTDIVKAIKSGQVTATSQINAADAAKLSKAYSIRQHRLDSGVYAFFNTSRPALKDRSVRQALRAAIDMDALRKTINKQDLPLGLPFVPGQLSDKGIPVAPGYDPKAAAVLLDKAGWKLGGGMRKKDGQVFTIDITTLQGTEYQRSAQLIAADWEKLGIKVTVNAIDPDDPRQDFTQNVIQPRAYDVLVYELAIGADLDVYAFWHSSQAGPRGLNLSVYGNPTSDAALTSARARVEPELRDVKYKAFSKQWLSDAPAVGLFQSSILYISSKDTNAIAADQRLVSAYDRYATILDWAVEKATVYKTP